jgi:hypothetical protein
MRAFSDYLVESTKKYMFRVRIATELSKENMDRLEAVLQKYDCDGISEPKRLPIQQKAFGFEHLDNPEVYIVDIVTNYPCTPIELQAAFNTAGIPSSLVMVTTPNQEVLVAPIASEADDGKAILDKDLPKNTYPQVLADLETALSNREPNKYQYTYAAKKTSTGKTSNDLPQGTTSPIGTKQNKLPTSRNIKK